MSRFGPAAKRLLAALVLAMASAIASMGVTFGCLIRNLIRFPEHYAHNFSQEASAKPYGHLRGTSLADMSLTVLFALLMLAWIWAFVHFLRHEPRSPLTWVLGAMVIGVFVWSSWGNWHLAYPVCNSF